MGTIYSCVSCKTNPIFLNLSNGLINHSPRTTQVNFPTTAVLAPFQIVRRENLPRQDAPRPSLVPRHVPANVAVAVLPLQNDREIGSRKSGGRARPKLEFPGIAHRQDARVLPRAGLDAGAGN